MKSKWKKICRNFVFEENSKPFVVKICSFSCLIAFMYAFFDIVAFRSLSISFFHNLLPSFLISNNFFYVLCDASWIVYLWISRKWISLCSDRRNTVIEIQWHQPKKENTKICWRCWWWQDLKSKTNRRKKRKAHKTCYGKDKGKYLPHKKNTLPKTCS